MIPVWIATITALDANDAPITLHFSDCAYIDDDWNYYSPVMAQPAMVKISPNDGGVFHCFSSPSTGEIELLNISGHLNYLSDYAVDNGIFSLSLIDSDGFQTDFMTGKISATHSTDKSIFLALQSMSELLGRPHPNTKYLGTNALPAGVEGNATDIKGNVKPRIFGSVKNATPILVNTAATSLIYQFSDRASCIVTAVYDKGGAFTLGVTYPPASLATFISTAVTVTGTFNRCMGYVKLYVSPVGVVTGDAFDGMTLATSTTNVGAIATGSKTFVTQANKTFAAGNLLTLYSAANPANFMTGLVTSYTTTSLVMNITVIGGSGTPTDWIITSNLAGDVLNEIVNETPVILGISLNSASKPALNAAGEIGVYVTGATNTAALLNQVVASTGAIWYFNGLVIYAKLIALATTYTLELTDSEIISLERTGTGLGTNGVPITACSIDFDKIETVQKKAELIATVTNTRVAYLSLETRSAFINDSTVLTRHPMAEAITVNSALRTETDAIAMGTRLLNLCKTRVDVVNITCVVAEIPALSILDGVLVTTNKLSYSDGRTLTIIGFEIDAKRRKITLQLIG